MFVLSKVFGECPQVMILEVFADHFEEELSIPDLIWLTDMPKTTMHSYISKLLDEKILLKGNKVGKTQFYRLNNEKQEVRIVLSLVNYIVSEKLAEKLEERGIKQIEEHEVNIAHADKKNSFWHLIKAGKNYSTKLLNFLTPGYNETKRMTLPKYNREVNREVCI